ncbi:MAG: acetylserotonin O-methyltransferase, partial [Ignavibacteriaceae bacterium]|nr:acetylserotonin O-methyltransferase [Ignavibacteriaceae bacterium]
DKHMMTSEEVSTKIDADPRATDRLMNALCGMGILKKVKRKFYNSDLSSKYLVEGKPEFMGNLYHTNHLWNTWSYLTDSVKKGSSFKGDQNKKEKTNWVEAFIGAMHYRGVNQGKILSMMIDLSNVRKMIDVGGGSAAFSIEIVKKNPSIKATVLDLPHVVPLTKKYVEEAGLSDNFNFIEGDYLTKDFEDNYDLILLSAIVHINSYEQNKMLINKCADALNKNGMIIISDFVMNDDRTQPVHGALFSINMLVGTASGDTYTEGEMKEWFESADLSKIERKNTSFGSDLMIGIK